MERTKLSPYWNRREVLYWIASAALVAAYGVAVIVFGADPDPVDWLP